MKNSHHKEAIKIILSHTHTTESKTFVIKNVIPFAPLLQPTTNIRNPEEETILLFQLQGVLTPSNHLKENGMQRHKEVISINHMPSEASLKK